MNNGLKVYGMTILIVLLSYSSLNAQAEFSDAFTKTVKKIAKRKVKEGIIKWLTEKDPVIGIVGRDLIGQIIDGRDKEQIIRSTVNVVVTMLYINRVQSVVKDLLSSGEYDEVKKQSGKIGWSDEKLSAYSSLYFFYSERIKYGLYISPYIREMKNTQNKIESLRTIENKKWVSTISKKLIRIKIKEKDITLDVRTLEILEYAINGLISGTKLVQRENNIVDDLVNDYGLSSDSTQEWVMEWKENRSLERVLPLLFEIYSESISKSYSKYLNEEDISFHSVVLQNLLSPLRDFIKSVEYSLIDPTKSQDRVYKNLKFLLYSWLENYNSNSWGVSYKMSLAGTYLRDKSSVDFTVLDFVSYGYSIKKVKVFAYIGGFIDPLIKSTVNEGGERVYPIGIGSSMNSFNLLIGIGVPYDNIEHGNYDNTITIGYEISLTDYLD